MEKINKTCISNICHEFSTSLTHALSNLKGLQKNELSIQQRNYLTMIHQNSEQLHSLVNTVLKSTADINLMPCDLPKLLRHIEIVTKLKTQLKGLHFETELPHNLPSEVLTDSSHLRKIVLALLLNAVKFTTTGEIRLKIELAEQEEESVELIFAITDNSGLSAEKLTGMLTPTTTQQYGGDLALPAAHELLQQLGSQLQVEETSAGCCFYFHLKLTVLRWQDNNVADPSAQLIAPPLDILDSYWRNLLLGRLPELQKQLKQLMQTNQYQPFAEHALVMLRKRPGIHLRQFLQQFFPLELYHGI